MRCHHSKRPFRIKYGSTVPNCAQKSLSHCMICVTSAPHVHSICSAIVWCMPALKTASRFNFLLYRSLCCAIEFDLEHCGVRSHTTPRCNPCAGETKLTFARTRGVFFLYRLYSSHHRNPSEFLGYNSK